MGKKNCEGRCGNVNEGDLISRQAAIEAMADDIRFSALMDNVEASEDIEDYKPIAEHALRNVPTIQPKKGKWISCEERLPEPRKAVLGYAPKWKNVFALYYDAVYGWMVWSPISDDCFPNMYGDIVAWMPMPEYEEEQI